MKGVCKLKKNFGFSSSLLLVTLFFSGSCSTQLSEEKPLLSTYNFDTITDDKPLTIKLDELKNRTLYYSIDAKDAQIPLSEKSSHFTKEIEINDDELIVKHQLLEDNKVRRNREKTYFKQLSTRLPKNIKEVRIVVYDQHYKMIAHQTFPL